jgi:hypothetical protein
VRKTTKFTRTIGSLAGSKTYVIRGREIIRHKLATCFALISRLSANILDVIPTVDIENDLLLFAPYFKPVHKKYKPNYHRILSLDGRRVKKCDHDNVHVVFSMVKET